MFYGSADRTERGALLVFATWKNVPSQFSAGKSMVSNFKGGSGGKSFEVIEKFVTEDSTFEQVKSLAGMLNQVALSLVSPELL